MKKNKIDLFEDCTTLKWVKWSKRKPAHNGSVYIRWNGKNTSNGIVHKGELMSLSGEKTKYVIKNKKLIMKYTKNQKEQMKNMYWLEEVVDVEKFRNEIKI